MAESLNYRGLDDIAIAASCDRLPAHPPSKSFTLEGMGPLVEWVLLARAGVLPFPDRTAWIELGWLAPAFEALRSGASTWVAGNQLAGLFHTRTADPEGLRWVSFCKQAQSAAQRIGLSRTVVGQSIAAFYELQGNILEHSGRPHSGLCAYRVTPRDLEFVVGDSGAGVLASLRTCPEHRAIETDAQALRAAISPGTSRHGSGASRGEGFQPIFVGLANYTSDLRFRSGDAALEIERGNPNLQDVKSAQKVRVPGFIASVRCEAN